MGKLYLGSTEIANININATSADTSDATATVTDIVYGKTAYVNGQKITGTAVVQTCWTGSGTPANNLGVNGDLYIDLG